MISPLMFTECLKYSHHSWFVCKQKSNACPLNVKLFVLVHPTKIRALKPGFFSHQSISYPTSQSSQSIPLFFLWCADYSKPLGDNSPKHVTLVPYISDWTVNLMNVICDISNLKFTKSWGFQPQLLRTNDRNKKDSWVYFIRLLFSISVFMKESSLITILLQL